MPVQSKLCQTGGIVRDFLCFPSHPLFGHHSRESILSSSESRKFNIP
jgi:hypothetical protein